MRTLHWNSTYFHVDWKSCRWFSLMWLQCVCVCACICECVSVCAHLFRIASASSPPILYMYSTFHLCDALFCPVLLMCADFFRRLLSSQNSSLCSQRKRAHRSENRSTNLIFEICEKYFDQRSFVTNSNDSCLFVFLFCSFRLRFFIFAAEYLYIKCAGFFVCTCKNSVSLFYMC